MKFHLNIPKKKIKLDFNPSKSGWDKLFRVY